MRTYHDSTEYASTTVSSALFNDGGEQWGEVAVWHACSMHWDVVWSGPQCETRAMYAKACAMADSGLTGEEVDDKMVSMLLGEDM